MSVQVTPRIAPEAFDLARHEAAVARQAAMKKLVGDLWRVMTTPLWSQPAHRAISAAKDGKPCVSC